MATAWRYVGAILLLSLAAVQAGAQEKAPVVPAGLIPTPDRPGIVLSLKTDKGSYAPGEALKVTFTLPRPAHVYLYNLTADGKVQLLVPNRFLQETYFPAGTHTLPTRGWVLRVTEPEGVEYLQLLASEVPLSFYDAKAFEKDAFLLFSQPAQFAATLRGLLGEMWGATWTSYRVHKPKAYLTVVTTPPGALVTVGGRAVGTSPVSTSIAPGRHRVEISLAGYETRSVNLTAADGEEIKLRVALTPVRSTRPTRPTAPTPSPPVVPTPPRETQPSPPAGTDDQGTSRPIAPPVESPLPGSEPPEITLGVGFAAGLDSLATELWVGRVGLGVSARPAPPSPDPASPGPGGEYPAGPEIEGYLSLWIPLGRVGPVFLLGLSGQEMAWFPGWSPTAVVPQVVVEPETWMKPRATFGIGLGLSGDGWRVQFLWHNRRGGVLGVVLRT